MAKALKENITLRSTDEGYEHRIWTIKHTSWGRYGQVCVLQNNVQPMESRPSRILIDYKIKVFDGVHVSFPSIRETVGMLNTQKDVEVDIDGVRKHLSEWAKDKKNTIELLKQLAEWA